MLKKLAFFVLAAMAGIMFITGCTKESPKEVVSKANMMQNHDFEAIKGYYTEDFMASVEESLTNTVCLFDLPTLEGIMKFIHAHNLKAIDFYKIMANNKVLAEFYGGRGDYYDAKQILKKYEHWSEEEKALLEEQQREDIREFQEVFKGCRFACAGTYKIIDEDIDGDTATVTAEYQGYNISVDDDTVKKVKKVVAKHRIVYTLKKIDNEWKITKAVDTVK